VASRKKRPPVIGDVKKCAGMRVAVFLNQKLIENVIEYNCETGYILKEKVGKDGLPFLENDAIATEELHGSVLVKRID